MKTISETIKNLMSGQGLTFADMSETTGIPVRSLQYAIKNNTFKSSVIPAIADALDVSVAHIFGEDDAEKKLSEI